MIKRTLMALGLGVALMGGAATAAHASSVVAAHPAAVQADLVAGATGDQTMDADANAPCATDAAGNQTGNCQDSQNASGPADNGGTPGAAEGPDSGAGQAGQ